MYIPTPAPEGRADNLQLTYITPKVGMIYPIPAYIFDLQIFPNCGQNISNTNLYVKKCIFPTPDTAQTTSNLHISPQVLAEYI